MILNAISGIAGSCAVVFHQQYRYRFSHQQCMRVPISLHFPQNLLLSIFWFTAILVNVKWYFIVLWICILLVIEDIKHFAYAYWPHFHIFGRNVYSNPLPIFYLGYLSFYFSVARVLYSVWI